MLLLHLICFFVVCGAGITALCVQVPLVSYACLAIGVAAKNPMRAAADTFVAENAMVDPPGRMLTPPAA